MCMKHVCTLLSFTWNETSFFKEQLFRLFLEIFRRSVIFVGTLCFLRTADNNVFLYLSFFNKHNFSDDAVIGELQRN